MDDGSAGRHFGALNADGARQHLLIAGTGRAGTSFLVRYLAGLGLDTHLARQGGAASWNEDANAGFEDLLIAGTASATPPYVVKSPWLHEYIGHLLGSGTVKLDAVIIPVRPLDEAAASRVVLELRAMHERTPWMAELGRTWEHCATTAGGSVFSMHPLDQARVLATGFHRLVEHLVRADVPMVLLDFPRLVLDADYLFNKLAPVLPLPPGMDARRAADVHGSLADAAKIRIGPELAEAGIDGASLATLDLIAIKRELARLRRVLAEQADQAAGAASEAQQLQAKVATLAAENERLQVELSCARTRKPWFRAKAAEWQAARWRRLRPH